MYLGVDGGGSKTAFVLVSSAGELRAERTESGAYHVDVGIEAIGTMLERGVGAICQQAGIGLGDINYAFFGLPTYGEDRTLEPVLQALPARFLPRARYACGNDMICGWAGSLGAQDGINVVAGTGSIAYGEHQGRGIRCGGWGELFGDEGSAYWIARQGLELFTRMSDGRIPLGPLHERIRSMLKLELDLDLLQIVYGDWGGSRERIASLSRAVSTAALDGDAAAREILAHAGVELAAMVDAIRRQLGYRDDEPVAVSYSGGIFDIGAAVLEPFAQALRHASPRYDLRQPLMSPARGGALYAARLHGTSWSAEVLTRLARSR